MKSYSLEAFGLQNLKIIDTEIPTAGSFEVLVKISAVSLNFRDLRTVEGSYNPKQPLPLIPMSDCAGEIVSVGDQVTRFKVGDRVMGCFMQKWIEGDLTSAKSKSSLGGPIHGVFSEYRVFHEDGLVSTPEHLTDSEAATLPCAAVTAWHAMFEPASVKPGDTVLIQGTGGVSLFALQLAKMAGAKVILTSSSDEKLEKVKALGADETINYKSIPDWDKRVKELTRSIGVDHVIEVGGAGTLPKSLRAIRPVGNIYMIGVLSGASQEINVAPILHQNAQIKGIYVGSRLMFENMLKAINLHKMKPVIDKIYCFEEARTAFEHMKSGSHFGKIVVSVG